MNQSVNEKYIKISDLQKFPIRADHYDTEHGDARFISGIETVMEYAEHIAAGWIPTAERLPEKNGQYLCTIKDDEFPGDSYVAIVEYGDPSENARTYWDGRIYDNGKAFGDDWSHPEYGEEKYRQIDNLIKVLAWMPMPEPYRGGDSE